MVTKNLYFIIFKHCLSCFAISYDSNPFLHFCARYFSRNISILLAPVKPPRSRFLFQTTVFFFTRSVKPQISLAPIKPRLYFRALNHDFLLTASLQFHLLHLAFVFQSVRWSLCKKLLGFVVPNFSVQISPLQVSAQITCD